MHKIIITLLAVSIFGCQNNMAQKGKLLQTIPVNQYYELVKNPATIQMVDVRTPDEFNKGHINGAVNIDYNNDNFETEIAKLDTNKTTFIYCLSGGRSASAMEKMSKIGYDTIYNLGKGMLAWEANNKPQVGDVSPKETSLTMEQYKKLTMGDTPVLIDFYATWCGPCKMLKPQLQKIEEDYKGKVKIIAIDVDKNRELANEMKIASIPLLLYYKNGVEKQRLQGFNDFETIVKQCRIK
jgi:thioredoxin